MTKLHSLTDTWSVLPIPISMIAQGLHQRGTGMVPAHLGTGISLDMLAYFMFIPVLDQHYADI